jgi:hypothetical protein
MKATQGFKKFCAHETCFRLNYIIPASLGDKLRNHEGIDAFGYPQIIYIYIYIYREREREGGGERECLTKQHEDVLWSDYSYAHSYPLH